MIIYAAAYYFSIISQTKVDTCVGVDAEHMRMWGVAGFAVPNVCDLSRVTNEVAY